MADVDCRVCGLWDEDKPMAFKGESWCSDDHRKVIVGEKEPTEAQRVFMSARAIAELPGGFLP